MVFQHFTINATRINSMNLSARDNYSPPLGLRISSHQKFLRRNEVHNIQGTTKSPNDERQATGRSIRRVSTFVDLVNRKGGAGDKQFRVLSLSRVGYGRSTVNDKYDMSLESIGLDGESAHLFAYLSCTVVVYIGKKKRR